MTNEISSHRHPLLYHVTTRGERKGVFVPFLLIDLLQDYASAILLAQIIWHSGNKGNGWFYKSSSDWYDELSMSEDIVRRCLYGDKRSPKRIALTSIGVKVKIKRANGAPTRHFMIDSDEMESALNRLIEQREAEGVNVHKPDKSQYRNLTNPSNDTGQIPESLTESSKDYKESAAPDKPSRVPDEKQPTQQQMLVGALFDAFGITAPTGPDKSKVGKVAKELAAVGIAAEDVPDLVAFVRRQAAGQWTVTMMSLIGNGRVSQYLQAKERTEQAVTMVADDDWDPAAHIGTPEEVEAGRLRAEAARLMAQGIVPDPNWRDRLPDYMRDDD